MMATVGMEVDSIGKEKGETGSCVGVRQSCTIARVRGRSRRNGRVPRRYLRKASRDATALAREAISCYTRSSRFTYAPMQHQCNTNVTPM